MSSTGRSVLRVLAVVLGGAWLFLAFVAGSFIGWSSESLGWLWSGLAFGSGLVLAVLLWRPRDRRFPLAAAAAAALVLGLVDWQSSPPTHERIADHADEVTVPAEWASPSESLRGNTWCYKGCPLVERSYSVPGPYDEAVAAATRAFEEAGWSVGETRFGTTSFQDGRWHAEMTESYPYDDDVTEVMLSFSG